MSSKGIESENPQQIKMLQNTVATFLTLTWNLSYHILKFKRKDYDKNEKFRQFIACKIQEYKKFSFNDLSKLQPNHF